MAIDELQSFSEFPLYKLYFEHVDRTLNLCAKMEHIAEWLDGIRNDGAINMAESPRYIMKALKVNREVAVKVFHVWRETIEARELAGELYEHKACISDAEQEFPNCNDDEED